MKLVVGGENKKKPADFHQELNVEGRNRNIYPEFVYFLFCFSVTLSCIIFVLTAFSIDVLLGLFKRKRKVFIAIVNIFINTLY